MTDLRSLTLGDLRQFCEGLGWKAFRARQLYAWIWQRGVTDLDAMTDIGKAQRRMLSEQTRIGTLQVVDTSRADDGTAKIGFSLADGETIESVYIPEPNRRTVCVSTQAGCRLGCAFCRTAAHGFRRNLGWHEIAGQVLDTSRLLGRRPTNVVFMGMGEPFLNYESVLTALRELNSDHGINIGARKLTVSTAGIPARIREYARFELQSKLAVSLNASDDDTRSELMPVNRRYPLAELLSAVREFTAVRNKRVTFEYVLVDGLNNRDQDVHQLGSLLRDIPCKVNLIPLNPVPGSDLRSPSDDSVRRFADKLYPVLPAVTIRRSRGADILAACGQLAGR